MLPDQFSAPVSMQQQQQQQEQQQQKESPAIKARISNQQIITTPCIPVLTFTTTQQLYQQTSAYTVVVAVSMLQLTTVLLYILQVFCC